jgi:hypothetical protein
MLRPAIVYQYNVTSLLAGDGCWLGSANDGNDPASLQGWRVASDQTSMYRITSRSNRSEAVKQAGRDVRVAST